MNKKRTVIFSIIVITTLLFASCRIRFSNSGQEGNVETAVAQTLAAEQQDDVVQLPTITARPTITPKPGEPTSTPRPCNKASAVSETYPDDTEVEKDTDFDKSWRLQNIGTCTWNANYQIAFFDGHKMSGPTSKKLGVNVAPGETIDIILDLVAPGAEGTHRGTWKLQDDEGENFATVWVQIKSVAGAAPPPLPPAIASVSLSYIEGEGGSVRSGGSVHNGLENVGDTTDNQGSQVFLSFDISGIPAGATITDVTLDFSDYDTLDDPFGDMGCLRAYVQNYNNLDAGDYFSGTALGAIARWCNTGELDTVASDPDFVDEIQAKLGDTRFQIRLQFKEKVTNNDGNADMVRFGDAKLQVTYTLP